MSAPVLQDLLDYAVAGWAVGPLRGKLPAIPNAHPEGDPLRGVCKGECGRWGHGCLDFTTDTDRLASIWRPGFNIGARPPEGVMVIDTDPRHGGEAGLVDLAIAHGGLPETLTAFSGRDDGGRHRYYLHPGGKVSASRLPAGVDLKTSAGYLVMPPSIHPATGKAYRWADADAPIAVAPGWLVRLLYPEVVTVPKAAWKPRVVNDEDSIADWFTAATTWDQVLEGWSPVAGGWRHPEATSPISATVRHDLLFVYSSNTPFEVTEAANPHGYTRFRAMAVLEHHGDLRAAARCARAIRDRMAVSA